MYHQILAQRQQGGRAQVIQTPPQVVFTGTVPGTVQQRGDAKKQVPTIKIVQKVKQIQTDRVRAKRVKRATKQSLTSKRKEYTAAKRAAKKVLQAQRKSQYEKENSKIKSLPVKQRKAARAKLRGTLKSRLAGALKLLPAPGKLNLEQLKKLISRAKTLKF